MLQVIADEREFVVVYKPANVDFHADQGVPGFFLQAQVQLGCKLFPVHRLDKVTSGLVVLAKSASTAASLGNLFAQHQVQKLYLAIASKKPKKKQGALIGDMERSRRSSWKLLNSRANPAITQFFSWSMVPGLRMYVLRPHTGKTHQLRVALKSVGVPILGDDLYGGDAADRTYLHAYQLVFTLEGRVYEFCILPQEGEFFQKPEFYQLLKQVGPLSNLSWPSVYGSGS